MRQPVESTRFRRDYKRELKTEPRLGQTLAAIIEMLAGDVALPPRFSDHALVGDWKGFRDLHVKPDLILIYRKRPGIVELARLGSHSELF